MATYDNIRHPDGLLGRVRILADVDRTNRLLDGPFQRTKPVKLDHWIKGIAQNQVMPMPELMVNPGGGLDIMDGRHRLLALAETGYTHAWVTCEPDHEEAVRAHVTGR